MRQVLVDDATAALRLLVDRRDGLGRVSTETISRLQHLLLELVPGARLVDEQRVHVYQLHEQVGLILQTCAETAGDADAAMPLEDLQAFNEQTLTDDRGEADQAARMASRSVKAATDRLVLIVPRAVGKVGLESRSLPEL